MDEKMKQAFSAMKAERDEAFRNMQTELLGGMSTYPGSPMVRLRKGEADQSNVDAAISGRVDVLERRIVEIEQRLGIAYP